MNFIRLIMLCTMSFMGSAWCAESTFSPDKPAEGAEQVFKLNLAAGRLTNGSLVCCDQKYIERCNEYGISCLPNEIFMPVQYNSNELTYQTKDDGLINKADQEFESITHLPVKLFMSNNKALKKIHLFDKRLQVDDKWYLFKFFSNLIIADDGMQRIEEEFRGFPKGMRCGDRPSMLSTDDDDKIVEEEQVKAGIFARVGGELIHGPNGYFGKKEYEKQKTQYEKKHEQKVTPLVEETQPGVSAEKKPMSKLQKFLIGSLLAGLGGGMYLLYKQYTEPATVGEVNEGFAAMFLKALSGAYNGMRIAVQSKMGY